MADRTPAQEEALLPVSEAARNAAADYIAGTSRIDDVYSAEVRSGIHDENERDLLQAFARFEATIRTAPASAGGDGVERIVQEARSALVKLAHCPLGLSLSEWNDVSNKLLAAIDVAALKPTPSPSETGSGERPEHDPSPWSPYHVYRDALAYYADERRWATNSAGLTPAMDDRGHRAREALYPTPSAAPLDRRDGVA